MPMAGDVDPARHPNRRVLPKIVKKPFERLDSAGLTDNSWMQAD